MLQGAKIKKDEFETTVNFHNRQKLAINNVSDNFIIAKDVDQKYLRYDADTQLFTIQTFLFDNENMNYDFIEKSTSFEAGVLGNVDVVISQTDTQVGSFVASNSYGTKATVTKLNRVTKGIWERPSQSMFTDLFLTGTSGSTLVSMKLAPERAKIIKPQLKIAFLVTPKPPYVVRGVGKIGKTTINRPIEIVNDLTVLVGDIQCGFLMDSSNTVLGSFPTN
jgi:hypothetical protein